MAFKKVITGVVFAILLTLGGVDASYKIVGGGSILNTDTNPESNSDKYKVVFQVDDSPRKTMYVDEGYELSLKDAPSDYLINGSTSYYKYTADNGSVLNDHIIVDRDLVLTGTLEDFYNSDEVDITQTSNVVSVERYDNPNRTEVTSTLIDYDDLPSGTPIANSYNETLVPGNDYIGKPDNIVHLESYAYNKNVNLTYKGWVDGKRSNNIITDGNYIDVTNQEQSESNNEVTTQVNCKQNFNGNFFGIKGSDGKPQSYNGDYTIGLEHTCDDTNFISNYKPMMNAQNNGKDLIWNGQEASGSVSEPYGVTNYCANRIVLENDAIWLGTLSIGGLTGFYGSNEDFSQYGFGGFIIGTYCELDLNGYDLICLDTDEDHNNDNHGMVNSWGSITDTSKDRSGNLIMEAGTYLCSPFVIEDEGRIEGIPVVYTNGTPAMSSFRCPYLDCNIIFRKQAKFFGEIKIDLAGNSKECTITEIYLIGDDSVDGILPWFQIDSSTDWTVERKVTYDDNKTFTDSQMNITNQSIHYNVYNANITMNSYEFDVSFKVLLSSHTFHLSSNKGPIIIPHYFSFDLFASTLKVNNLLVFMPGTYLNVDKKSKIVLTKGTSGSFSGYKILSVNIASQSFSPIGGMYFVDQIPISTMKAKNPGTGCFIYKEKYNWMRYYNSIGSHCNLYGSIEFEDDTGAAHKYELGGNINVFNEAAFQKSISDVYDNLQLIGAYAFSQQIASEVLKGYVNTFKNVVCYYVTTPLISNGKVITDLSDTNYNTANFKSNYVFDSTHRLIKGTDASGNSHTYAYFFNNYIDGYDDYSQFTGYANNIYKSNDLNYSDGLDGTFKEVNSYSNGDYVSILNSSDYFINYRGCFVKTNGVPSNTAEIPNLNIFSGDELGELDKTYTLNKQAYYTNDSSKLTWGFGTGDSCF